MKSRHLLVNTVTGLEAGCIAGVLWFGARILPAEPSQAPEESPAPTTEIIEPSSADVEPADATVSGLWVDEPVASDAGRSVVETTAIPNDNVVRGMPAAERRRERDYYRAFSALAVHGPTELERAARIAVEGRGPDCEKVAALRAVCDKNCPASFDLLADAALNLPDECRAQGDSVPRFAVRVLIDKASRQEEAKQALDRIAWNPGLSADMRCIAAAGIASVADEAGAWRIVSRLEIEQDTRVRESAAQALARNPAAGSAANACVQWMSAPPIAGDADLQHE